MDLEADTPPKQSAPMAGQWSQPYRPAYPGEALPVVVELEPIPRQPLDGLIESHETTTGIQTHDGRG